MKKIVQTKNQNLKKGFTLLELLVVVLIIGILAAIALPQYRLVVLKSKYAAIKNTVKAIADAETRYLLVNDTYTDNVDDLDIDVDMNNCVIESDYDITCWVQSGGRIEYKAKASEEYRPRCCAAPKNTTNIYNTVCRQETGKEVFDLQMEEMYCYKY